VAERERSAQRGPVGSLDRFPTHRVTTDRDLYRAHRVDRGPWWFGHDGGGRFDLPAPAGTCYTAYDPVSAVRERLGPVLADRTVLPESALEDAVVSRLRVPEPVEVADLQSRRAADFGATRELETMVPYAVPQEWARELAAAGHEGVRYGPRFTPGDASAVALFGEAGQRDWPVDPAPVTAAAVPGIPVLVPTPRRADLSVVRPPRTRTTPARPGG
jgi:hypothetical protein